MIRNPATRGLSGPRRARRGLGTLAAAVLVTGIIATAMMAWQVAVAAERIRGHARHLAEAVAAEGYGLHHWLHAERIAGTVTAPAEGTARALTATEEGRLAAHSATAAWRRSIADPTRPVLPRGWEIVHLVAAAGGPADGVLVLRPANDVVAHPTWDATRRALDVTLGTAEAGAAALAAATVAGYDATRDRAVPASRFARIDAAAMLREDHAGHPRLPMETAVRMGGNDLEGVNRLEGDRARIPVIDGDCRAPVPHPGTLTGTLCANGLVLGDTLDVNDAATLSTAAAADVTVTGAVTGITRIRTARATVAGTVMTPELTACADTEAALCGGGDLDIETATGVPQWTTASIFGDTVIRDGNRLLGVRDTRAATGIFGLLVGALTVRGCLRSVNPFIHGAGC